MKFIFTLFLIFNQLTFYNHSDNMDRFIQSNSEKNVLHGVYLTELNNLNLSDEFDHSIISEFRSRNQNQLLYTTPVHNVRDFLRSSVILPILIMSVSLLLWLFHRKIMIRKLSTKREMIH